MKWRPSVIALLILMLVLPGCATPDAGGSESRLDELFARLRLAASGSEAEAIELAILQQWAASGRPEIDLLMSRGIEMAHSGDLDGALLTFDRVVKMAPDFAEGFNQRALVHAMRDEYGLALTDLRQVLLIEPRHFAALAGMGRIFLLYDRQQAALDAFEAALEIDPHLDAIREQAEQLRDQLAGEPI